MSNLKIYMIMVLILGNINEIKIPEEKVYLTMDSIKRCIPGIIYIPKYSFLDNQNMKDIHDL